MIDDAVASYRQLSDVRFHDNAKWLMTWNGHVCILLITNFLCRPLAQVSGHAEHNNEHVNHVV